MRLQELKDNFKKNILDGVYNDSPNGENLLDLDLNDLLEKAAESNVDANEAQLGLD